MEKAAVIALLEKYWRAETTIEEEGSLAAWFNAQAPGTLDPELEPYGALFAYFGEEAQVHPAPGFEERLLAAVTTTGLPATTGLAQTPDPATTGAVAPVRPFRWGLIAAAATVLILVANLFLFQPSQNTTQPVDPTKTTANSSTRAVGQPVAAATIKDTYDDPEQALAAVRHALLIASAHLNEGRKQILNK